MQLTNLFVMGSLALFSLIEEVYFLFFSPFYCNCLEGCLGCPAEYNFLFLCLVHLLLRQVLVSSCVKRVCHCRVCEW